MNMKIKQADSRSGISIRPAVCSSCSHSRHTARTMTVLTAVLSAVLVLLCSAGFVWAETNPGDKIAVDVVGKTQGYSAELYNNLNGLPTSEANAITETPEGFMWIGSYSGLIRYDGNTFERMDSSTGVASVRSLYVDSRERLWIGTNDSGIYVMERGEFTHYAPDDSLKSISVRSFAEDSDGYIYAATTSGIIIIDSDMNHTLIKDQSIAGAYFEDLQVGADGLIYGITVNGDICTLRNRKPFQFFSREKLGEQLAVAVLPDDEHPGKVWLGMQGSEILYGELGDISHMKKISTSSLVYIKGLEKYQNQLWICSDNGIGVYDGKKTTVLDNVPMDHSVDHVMADYSGNLWFTSSRQGIMKIVPNRFEDVFERFGLESTVVNSTCIYDDKLFIGTDDGLTVTDDKKVVDSIPIDSAKTAAGDDLGATDLVKMLDGCRIRSIIPDREGNIWLATFSDYGLIRFDGKNVTCFTIGDGMPSDRMRAVYEKSDGSMLVACTGGVVVLKDDKIQKIYGESDGIANAEILTVTEADNGDIIAGSDGGGIYVINESGTQNINTSTGLSSNVIMRVKKDIRLNIYWIITSNAIAYMDEKYKVETVTGFPYSNNFDLYQNSINETWVVSSNGLYVATTEDLLSGKEITPVFFGVDNGLPAIATGNSYSGLTEDGDLYVACSSGVVKVNIDSSFENVGKLKVSVPYIDADEKTIYPSENGDFTIPAGTRKLTVYSYVYNYSLTNPQVTYWLKGFDKDKTTVKRSELTPVDYTNLRGGTYHFVVELTDSMGHGHKTLSVKIVKVKAFYEQPWFFIISGLLILLLLVYIVRYIVNSKTRAIEKKHQETRRRFEQTAEALASAIDAKDAYTNGHSRRVAEYSLRIATLAGKSQDECDRVYFAALLHDVGKIGVPIEILSKKGKLTDEEFEQIKFHPVAGGHILENIKESPWLKIGARYHHERYNGRGYPEGLKGEDIPELARIIAVADAYDAMTSNRSYRNAIPQNIVREEIVKGIGTQFDPEYAKIMIHMIDQDAEYKMREIRGDEDVLPESIRCDSLYNECTEGILIADSITSINLCSQPDEGVPSESSLPTLILFDSLDSKVHPGEENNKDLMYSEYARIRLDGAITEEDIRKSESTILEGVTTIRRSEFSEPVNEQIYSIEAVKYKDHAMLKISDEDKTTVIVLALPDSCRFLYISIGGENCYIHNIRIDKEEERVAADYIPRIAEEVSYIKGCPVGDVSNIEVTGWCSEATEGIPVKEGMRLTFRSMSLPTARLVWHCPYIIVFSSDDGMVNGRNYHEYMLFRLDGENWDSDDHVENEVKVDRTEEFRNWEYWKSKNKEGLVCEVIINRAKNVIRMHTENVGISIDSVTTILDNVKDVYVAISGDQVAVTDVHVDRKSIEG